MSRPATDWAATERVIRVARRTLLYGPPGTGKTTVAQSSADGRPIFRVSLHDEMTVAELLGHFVPVGDRFIWLDGPALAAWRVGGRLILDEVDLAGGAVLSVCRAILDDERVAQLTIPNRSLAGLSDEKLAEVILAGEGLETVRPARGFQVVATMNGEPEDLDEPLVERFDAKYYIGEPHPNAIAALPAPLRTVAKRTACETDPARRVSVRMWHNFVNLAKQVGPADAGQAVFGARAGDIVSGLRLGGVDLDALFARLREDAPVPVGATPTAATPRATGVRGTLPTGAKGRMMRKVLEATTEAYEVPPTVAERAGTSGDTARRYLPELERLGMVESEGGAVRRAYRLTPYGKDTAAGS